MPELRRRLRSNAENFVQSDGLYVHSNPPRALQINSAYIKQLIRNGDIEKLQNLVLEGKGKRLIGGYSADYKTRAFLKNVPNTISKINLLHDAVNSGRLEELESLLEDEPDRKRLILAKDDAGVGILHKAVYYNLTDVIKWIIANYPQAATVKDSEGRTPCHYTPACKDPDSIQKLLINAGADISSTDNRQRTTQYYMKHPSELELPSTHKIITRSSRKSTPCNEGVVIKKSNIRIWIHQRDLGNLQKVLWEGHGSKLLVEHSTNPKVKKFLEAVPPILGLIKDVHTDVVNDDLEQLRVHSSSPVPPVILSAKDVNGLTPLHKAAGLGHQVVAGYIIDNYPNCVNITDNEGRTPLHWSTLAKDDGKMFDFLIGAGADESLLDNKQKTAAYYKQRTSEIDSKMLHVIPECPRTSKESFADWGALANPEIISKPIKKLKDLVTEPSDENHKPEKQTTEEPEIENKDDVHANGTEEKLPVVPEPVPEPEIVAKSIPEVANQLVETVIDDVIANGDISDDVEDLNPDVEEPDNEDDDDGTLHEPITESEDVEVLPVDVEEVVPVETVIVEESVPDSVEVGIDKDKEVAPTDLVTKEDVQTRVVTPKPETPKPDTSKPDTPKPKTPKPDTPKPDTLKPVTPKPETPKPETPKPETPKPVTPKPVTSKPVTPAPFANEVVVDGEGVIEGIVNGENEIESVNEQGQGVDDKEDDPEILALIEEGNMEQMAALVLNGDGEKLVGYHSDNPELQAFLDNVPTYMSKINRIHVAARDGSLKDLQAALDRRKFAIAKDHISPNGTSPLHVATIFGNTSIVRYLAGRFPETVQAVDNTDRTPLHYAAVLDDNNHYYNLLVHLGANPTAEDKLGHTPEYYRTDREDFNHRFLLREFGAEDVADDIIHDKVPNDDCSARKNLDDADMLSVLERCYNLLHGRRSSNATSAASSLTSISDISNYSLGSVPNKHMKRYVFDAVKLRLTKLDHNFYDIIWPSVKKLPLEREFRIALEKDFPLGIVIPDYYSYSVFHEYLEPVIKDANFISVSSELKDHPETKFFEKGDVDNFDLDLDPYGKCIVTSTLECTRNVDGFDLPKSLNVNELEEVERILTSALLDSATAKALYPNASDQDLKERGSGSYYTMNEVLEDPSEIRVVLASNGLLIPLWNIPDSDRLHGKHWPYGRGVFVSSSGNLAAWINVLDHLRIVTCTSALKPGNIGQIYFRIYRLLNAMSKGIGFRRDQRLGYLSARPTSLGNTLHFNLTVRFPYLIKEPENLRHLCTTRNLTYNKCDHSSDAVRIGNRQTVGLTEMQTFDDFTTAVANILQLEKDLAMSNSMHIAALFVNIFRRKKAGLIKSA